MYGGDNDTSAGNDSVAAAALTLHLDTAIAYKTTILADSIAFVIAGLVVLLAVVRLAPVPAPPGAAGWSH